MELSPTQAVFNKVYVHLLTQKKKAKTKVNEVNGVTYDKKINVCAYRGQNGTKCAFGAVIPDEDYLPEMEGQYAERDIFANVLTKLGVGASFMILLQAIHDNTHPLGWKRELAEFAQKYQLEIPEMPAKR
jgi:hypothetical protein